MACEAGHKRLLCINQTYIVGQVFILPRLMGDRHSITDHTADFVVDLLQE